MKSKFFAVIVALLMAQSVLAGDFNLHVDAPSQFWYRGALIEDNLVIQPSFTVIKDNLSATVWSNFSTITSSVDEVDGVVNYSVAFGNMNVVFGAQVYHVVGLFDTFDMSVLFASEHDINLLMVYDFFYKNGLYQELSFTPKVKVANTQLLITAALATNVHYARVDSGFSHVYGLLSLPLPIGDFKVIPSVYHQQSLASDIASGTFAQLSMDASF